MDECYELVICGAKGAGLNAANSALHIFTNGQRSVVSVCLLLSPSFGMSMQLIHDNSCHCACLTVPFATPIFASHSPPYPAISCSLHIFGKKCCF